MRDDMFKVLVERPRLRHPRKHRYWDGRNFRNRVHDDEDGGFAPRHLGMKAGYRNTKWLNENLAPLKRWLHAQVNRPWEKVHRELCSGMDDRNEVQAHILTHVDQFVTIDTRLVDNQVYGSARWRGGYVPIGETACALFVHPRTRILLPNREYLRACLKVEEARKREQEEAEARRKLPGEREELHLVDGIWYVIGIAPIPPGDKCWDVLLRRYVENEALSGRRPNRARNPYDKPGWYAASKRQLGKKELKRYGLTAKKAGNSRPFACERGRVRAGLRSRFCCVRHEIATASLLTPRDDRSVVHASTASRRPLSLIDARECRRPKAPARDRW